MNEELCPVKPGYWVVGGEFMEVGKIDDYTVRFHFAAPYPAVIYKLGFHPLARNRMTFPVAPKHYLKQYHIKYNPRADELAKKEGFDTWWMCFNSHYAGEIQSRNDVNFPTIDPWTLKEMDRYGNKYFERNPYYWKIDTAGNQLPYIDRQVRVLVQNQEIANLKTIQGEFTHAIGLLLLENYPLYKENEEKGGYRVTLWESQRGAEQRYIFNYCHKDPVLRKIFWDIRFRQAMSLAIKRDEINEVCFLGKGVPRQSAAPPANSFYEDWMGKYYAQYDPERANELLDEMGLKWDKDHKYRLRPDGKTLMITLDYHKRVGPKEKINVLVKDYWEDVGMKVDLKEISQKLYSVQHKANEHDIFNWNNDLRTEFGMAWRSCDRFKPPFGINTGKSWSRWHDTNGKAGEEPPEEIKELFRLTDEWLTIPLGTEKSMKLGREILARNVKGLYEVGTVGMAPYPCVMKKNLLNTPEEGVWGPTGQWYFNHIPDQWFFKK